MTENDTTESRFNGSPRETGHAEETLAALLRDLDQLAGYLTERGRHTYELAQRFLENARQDASSRAYDERQATMLEYQHYIWHEIAGLVNKLLVTYGDATPELEPDPGATPENGDN
jgi:site-specific recombinase XerD